jgi:hypothetical protein
MNIFEFFGLHEDHRPHPVQLVKHRQEVPESKLQLPVYAQVKRDGIFTAVCVTQNKDASGLHCETRVGIFGRTGKKLNNVEHLEAKYKARNFPVGVYFGELQTMCIDMSLEMLSGVVNPNRTEPLDYIGEQIKEELYIDFFDMMTVNGFIAGYTDITFLKRFEALKRRLGQPLAGLYEAILPLTECKTEEDVEAFAQANIDADHEGAVFKCDEDWEAGHKGWRQTKIVREVQYDLTCVGYEEGKGKCKGMVAKLIFKWKNGKTMKAGCGKGWTHSKLIQMLHDIQMGGELNVIGKIFAVKGLQDSSKGGGIRLPKFGELRHDKEEPDVF